MGPGRMKWLAPVISKGAYRAARRPRKSHGSVWVRWLFSQPHPAIPELGCPGRGVRSRSFVSRGRLHPVSS